MSIKDFLGEEGYDYSSTPVTNKAGLLADLKESLFGDNMDAEITAEEMGMELGKLSTESQKNLDDVLEYFSVESIRDDIDSNDYMKELLL